MGARLGSTAGTTVLAFFLRNAGYFGIVHAKKGRTLIGSGPCLRQ